MKKVFKFLKLICKCIIYPSHLSIVVRDVFGNLYSVKADDKHLKEAIEWLKRSQDVTKVGGSSGIYTFLDGWKEPYPETTGYIIPTLLNYSNLTNDKSLVERALKMGDWEISIQLESGAVRGGVGINEYPIVFNTGQVMLGWIALYKFTKEEKYLKAAERAAAWLVGNQDEDGKWSKNTYNKIPHAYNVRVTWALLDVGVITNNNTFKDAAVKNIKWVLAQVKENGWIGWMGFTIEEHPFTHTIAYTLRGLLECAMLLEGDFKNEIISHILKASDRIITKYESLTPGANSTRDFMPGTFNGDWDSVANYSCLTGNLQLSIIWMKLYQINGDKRLLNTAFKNIEQVKSTQSLKSMNGGIRGAIAGSYPIWGGYIHYGYPNWATKFFADALMLKSSIVKAL